MSELEVIACQVWIWKYLNFNELSFEMVYDLVRRVQQIRVDGTVTSLIAMNLKMDCGRKSLEVIMNQYIRILQKGS